MPRTAERVGLGAIRGYGNLLPHQRVDQRGLTDVRAPHHGYKARAEAHSGSR